MNSFLKSRKIHAVLLLLPLSSLQERDSISWLYCLCPFWDWNLLPELSLIASSNLPQSLSLGNRLKFIASNNSNSNLLIPKYIFRIIFEIKITSTEYRIKYKDIFEKFSHKISK
jgi:hypothetical protein